MANKKNTLVHEKTFFEKLGDQAAHVKEELVAGKDHLVEFAGDAYDSVKSSIQEFKKRKAKPKKVSQPKKKAVAGRKAAKKITSTLEKKAKPGKKAIAGAMKKAAPKRAAVSAKKKVAVKRGN